MPSYIRNSHFVILVYDVTSNEWSKKDNKTFDNLEKWFEFLGNCSVPETKKFVVGNKIDLVEERITDEEEIK